MGGARSKKLFKKLTGVQHGRRQVICYPIAFQQQFLPTGCLYRRFVNLHSFSAVMTLEIPK